MLNIIIFGPPGSGKGTQALKIAEKYNLLHISTGDLFRHEMGNNTPLGLKAKSFISKGELVPDEVTIGMLKNRVNSKPDVAGYIFDGFPRTIPQAEALDGFIKSKGQTISALLALVVDEEEIIQRILKRGESSGRSDDQDEGIIRNRIVEYNQKTAPLFAYYDQKGLAHKIPGIGTIEEIFDRICNYLEGMVTVE